MQEEKKERKERSKSVPLLDILRAVVDEKRYPTVEVAAKELGTSVSTLTSRLRAELKTSPIEMAPLIKKIQRFLAPRRTKVSRLDLVAQAMGKTPEEYKEDIDKSLELEAQQKNSDVETLRQEKLSQANKYKEKIKKQYEKQKQLA